VGRSIHKAEFEAAARHSGEVPVSRRPEIALAGRSNVGKSTLLNYLTGRKALARTSRTPGCTRGLIFFGIDDRVTLVDLPGYGYASRSKTEREAWKRLVEGYLGTRDSLAGTLILIDIRRGPQEDELTLAAFLAANSVNHAFVATKCDKLPRSKAASALSALRRDLAPAPVLATSSSKGQGRDDVWRWIEAAMAEPGV
jgi:GTP-binding protein